MATREGKRRSDEIVDALLAPSADDVAASGFEGFEHYRDIVRIVLQVAVHGDNDFAGSVVKTGGERGGLTVIALQTDDGDAGIVEGNLAENLRSRVAALIVHVDEFDGFEAAGHDSGEAGMEFADAFLFVMETGRRPSILDASREIPKLPPVPELLQAV